MTLVYTCNQDLCHRRGDPSLEKPADRRSKGIRHFLDVFERDVLLAALDHTDVCAVELGELSEPLLGDALLFP